MNHLERWHADYPAQTGRSGPASTLARPSSASRSKATWESVLTRSSTTASTSTIAIRTRAARGSRGSRPTSDRSCGRTHGSFENLWGSRQRRIDHCGGRGAYTETVAYALAEALDRGGHRGLSLAIAGLVRLQGDR